MDEEIQNIISILEEIRDGINDMKDVLEEIRDKE